MKMATTEAILNPQGLIFLLIVQCVLTLLIKKRFTVNLQTYLGDGHIPREAVSNCPGSQGLSGYLWSL